MMKFYDKITYAQKILTKYGIPGRIIHKVLFDNKGNPVDVYYIERE